ncbi:MAG TPA: hypothetical protein VNI77_12465 [Nitrososphaera sp.]|nr:hypothetical protein [Nitrososphaera sp.]
MVSSHVFILGAGASRAAFPNGDKFGRKLPLVTDFVETLELQQLLESHGIDYSNKDIEDIYSQLFLANPEDPVLEKLNQHIVSYFSQLQIPKEVTLYDELILSLQKKDAIFSFNWDPLLVQAYSRNIGIKQLPAIHFLHGNVAIGVCLKDRHSGYFGNRCSKCNQDFSPSKLLFPISKKDYHADPFIQSEWDSLSFYLDNAFILTLFGYSAPRTDVEARTMMKKAWGKNKRNELNEIQLIDIKDRDVIEDTWSEFTYKEHYGVFDNIRDTLSFRYARRSCNAWGDAIMQSDPWSENPIPRFTKLQDLHDWVKPLVEEEIQFEESGIPLQKFIAASDS